MSLKTKLWIMCQYIYFSLSLFFLFLCNAIKFSISFFPIIKDNSLKMRVQKLGSESKGQRSRSNLVNMDTDFLNTLRFNMRGCISREFSQEK